MGEGTGVCVICPICLPGTIQEKSDLPLNVIRMVKLGLSHNVKPWPRSCTACYGSQLGKRRKLERLELVDHSKNLAGATVLWDLYRAWTGKEGLLQHVSKARVKTDSGCRIQSRSLFPSLVHSAQAMHSRGFRPANLFLASRRPVRLFSANKNEMLFWFAISRDYSLLKNKEIGMYAS